MRLDKTNRGGDDGLGGILDESYTSEGSGGEGTPAEGEAAIKEGASFEEITVEGRACPR